LSCLVICNNIELVTVHEYDINNGVGSSTYGPFAFH
jgi:hypothetical protein